MAMPRSLTLAGALLLLAAVPRVVAQDPAGPPAPAAASDGASIDSIVAALYASISGDAGEHRDWERFVSLFEPDHGRVSAVVARETGPPGIVSYRPATYVERNAEFLTSRGLHETEIARRTERYAHLAHCFSTFEGRTETGDEEPFLRGISSFQLWNDGERWWILSLVWELESEELPIPEEYERGQ